ncbi:MAG: AAA family ATPase [Planctomycetota bacterium]
MKNSENDFTLPPFPSFPSASRYVELGSVAESVHRVSRSVEAREAIAVVIGPPGTGKSLVCTLLAKQFCESHDVIQIGDTSISDETALLRMILHRLGVAFTESDHNELDFLVKERLTGTKANPNGAVLIIDEAASLEESILESIRRLTNLMNGEAPALSVILAGGVKLDETLASPTLEAFVQRIATRTYLHPLSLDETREYLRASIANCDASPDETISQDAISAIYHATSGIPRLMNQMMTEAIDCAADLGETLIDEHTVDRAWVSLQQLPSPMLEEPKLDHVISNEIEFGELAESATEETDAHSESRPESPFANTTEPQPQNAEQVLQYSTEPTFVQPIQDRGVDSISLFGDFEEEEPIEVGAGKSEIVPAAAADQIEVMLHSQVIGLSQFASDNTATRQVDQQERVFETDLDSMEPDSETTPESGHPSSRSAGVIWYDEPTDGDAQSEQDDDRDLVWVTEDVDIEPKPSAAPSQSHMRIDEAAEESDSIRLNIDYREMLQKMRGNR